MSVDHTHPFQVHFERDRYHEVEDMIVWCVRQLGEGGLYTSNKDKQWALITAFGKSSWLFKNQDDATMFALRWA